jgi:deoxyribonuclease V
VNVEFFDPPSSREQARKIIRQMAEQVQPYPGDEEPSLVAAVDTAYGFEAKTVFACAVITTFPEIELVERAYARQSTPYPYVPGLLCFREGPVMLQALSKLEHTPDIMIVSGHGLAHPQRCGIASGVGVATGIPTIGCSLRLLSGKHGPVDPAKGNSQPILLGGQEVGIAYRSKDEVKPIFISPGHLTSFEQSKKIVVQNLRGFRMPEPLRMAHLFVNKYKRKTEKKNKCGRNRHQPVPT